MSTKLTYDDYVILPNDGLRDEIVNGELYASRAPSTKHQRTLGNLFIALDDVVRPRKLGEVFFAPCDVVMSEIDVFQPDLFFISVTRRNIITKANIQGVPELIVEILSEGNRRYDEIFKLKRYDHCGVAEYWIADPEIDTFKIYRRVGGAFKPFDRVETITTPLLPDFSLDVRDVFAE